MTSLHHFVRCFPILACITLSLGTAPARSQTSPGQAETIWLDALDLETMEQGWGEPQAKRSVTRQPLSIGGEKFDRGVGTHAASSFRLSLDGKAETFEATIGLDDSAKGRGSVVFQIFADDKKVFDSGVVRPETAGKPVSIKLRGAKSLVLAVTDAGDGYEFDHANWADARFMVAGAKPVPAQAAPVQDPIATLKVPGRSASRLAKPVTLPIERSLPGTITDWALMTVDGERHREYYLKYSMLGADGYRYAQRRGRASNGMKPMWVLVNQRTGQGLALMLAYMGNWTFEVLPKGGQISVRLATSPSDLKPFTKIDSLPVPGALVAEFTGHWDYGTQPIARFIRERLSRDLGPTWPPVQYNTWYDLYDKLTQQRLTDAAQVAKDVGCELFTVDAGWFGEGLEAKWSQTIGDWTANRDRMPEGMEAVAAAIHKLGMKFGLWFEIECAAPASQLAKEHPDWFLTGPDGKPLSKRSTLDFGKPEVLAHVKQVIDHAVTNYALDYIKMDFNTDLAIENDTLSQAEDPLYRHYRGMADLWRHIRKQHPTLIVEDCSSGARRHELTSAALTDTHWISDTIDNKPNLLIMFGATYFFPATTCSHWTTRPDPNDQVLDLDAQVVVNMMGHLGLSGAISSWDAKTLEIARDRIAQYKRLRPLLNEADVFHLTTPQLGAVQAALYSAARSGRALLFAFHCGDPSLSHTLHLRGLESSRSYRLSVPVGHKGMISQTRHVIGRELLEKGLQLTFPHPGAAALVEIEPE